MYFQFTSGHMALGLRQFIPACFCIVSGNSNRRTVCCDQKHSHHELNTEYRVPVLVLGSASKDMNNSATSSLNVAAAVC